MTSTVRTFTARSATQLARWLKVRAAVWPPALEIGVIVLWALAITRVYANLDPTVWPSPQAGGDDFPYNIVLYFNWRYLFQCGLCVLWNGSLNGGAPMLADVFTPIAHPALVIPVLLWGGINGAKVMVILSAIMAGLGQWWLAKVLRVGRVARVWVALLAVVGGHLWARMDYGTVAMLFTIAASSLFFAPLLDLALHGRRRAVVWLGLMMASAALSGQGYMQIAILFGALPPMVLFLFTSQLRLRPVWRSFGTAAGLTLLLAAIWWLPLLVFWPALAKAADPDFQLAQKNVIYTLFNLFIADDTFLHTALLGKTTAVSLYSNYISWVPLAFGVAALRWVPGRNWRVVAYLLLASWLIILTSTAWVFEKLPGPLGGFFSAGRDPMAMAALAVPPLLGLAALGFDALLKLRWPTLTLGAAAGSGLALDLRWLVVLLAVWAIVNVNALTGQFRRVASVPDIYPIEPARTRSAQWVRSPSFLTYAPKAVAAGLKLVVPPNFTTWNWNRFRPEPYLIVTTDVLDSRTPGYLGNYDGIHLVRMDQNEYAAVQAGDQPQQPCQAQAVGGNIDVVCDTAAAGVLTVYEHNWTGWRVYRDGASIPLLRGDWLQAEAPAGRHTYQFRYRPWDAALGAALTLAGWGLVARLLWRPRRPRRFSPAAG